jgi:hypothetical protein
LVDPTGIIVVDEAGGGHATHQQRAERDRKRIALQHGLASCVM